MTNVNKDNSAAILVSPAGKIVFSRLNRPAKTLKEGADYLEYSISMDFDLSAKGVAEFVSKLEDINDRLVVTKTKSKFAIAPGHVRVTARNKMKPTIFDKEGDKIAAEDVPMISSGTATLLLTTFDGSGKGGGINLQGVQLIDIQEYEGATGVNVEDLEAKLKSLK